MLHFIQLIIAAGFGGSLQKFLYLSGLYQSSCFALQKCKLCILSQTSDNEIETSANAEASTFTEVVSSVSWL